MKCIIFTNSPHYLTISLETHKVNVSKQFSQKLNIKLKYWNAPENPGMTWNLFTAGKGEKAVQVTPIVPALLKTKGEKKAIAWLDLHISIEVLLKESETKQNTWSFATLNSSA